MRRFKVIVIIVALVVGLAVVAACGSSSTSNSSQSGTLKSYSNSQFGFSLQYDSRFSESSGATAQALPGVGASAIFNIGFLDAKRTTADGKHADGIFVAVSQLGSPGIREQVSKLRSQLKANIVIFASAIRVSSLSPVAFATVNGTSGFRLTYTYESGATKLRATTYFLIKASREYELTIQSAADEWSELQPLIQKTVSSFTVQEPPLLAT